MPTVSPLDDFQRLEQEAALLRSPSVDNALTLHQRSALAVIEERIAELRRKIGLHT